MTDYRYPPNVVDATAPWNGGDLYVRAASGGTAGPCSKALYCIAIDGVKGRPDRYRCWESIPVNADADGYTDYDEKPEGALWGWAP